MSLDTDLLVRLQTTLTSAQDLGTATSPLSIVKQIHLTDGTGLNAANRVWSDTITVAASGTQDLDLAGSLTDALGGTFVLARVKLLYVAASAANTNNVVVGGDAAEWLFGAATSTIMVRPGGVLVLAAPDATGYAVTAATADILQIGNSGAGTGVTCDVVIGGAAS